MSKLVGDHVVRKGAGANGQRSLKGNKSTPLSNLRTPEEEPYSSRPPRVVGPNRETWILHELFLRIFWEGGEDIKDTFLQRLIGDKGGNEVVNFHMILFDPAV